ncbi:MAG: polyprenol monophosphomannose synthase [Verrucomicrobiae bacterium]|nr:polyprenol monophosphomannose synthase [Verrucomicrobiae bacterium]
MENKVVTGKTLVIIPTYNERDNIAKLIPLVLEQSPQLEVLVVEDASPDGTAAVVRELAQHNARVHLLERPGKLGLGTAYIAGFKWGLERGFDYLMEMDADFSHDPKEIPNFLKAIQSSDLVLGSRYKDGVRVVNWPLSRLFLSKGASYYVRLVTGLPVADPTGGFKCFRRQLLQSLDLDRVRSNGYAFQIELTYKAWINGFRITEIPITFTDRFAGRSKMSKQIVWEALWMVWALALANGFRRCPRARRRNSSPP